MYKELEKLHPDIVQHYRRTGKAEGIPEKVKEFIDILDRAAEIFNTEKNIARAARMLQGDFDIAFQTARQRIYDAINYFHLNNTVKEEAWHNFYADYFENLAKLALAKDDLTEARRNVERAMSARIKAASIHIDPDQLQPKDQMLTPDITNERLGLPDVNLKKIWNDTEEFIDNLNISNEKKEEVKNEARENLGIPEDVDHEEQ